MSEGSVPVDTATPELPDVLAAPARRSPSTTGPAPTTPSRRPSRRPHSSAPISALAQAAFFTGHGDEQLEAQERAFQAYLGAGDPTRAAYMAIGPRPEQLLRRAIDRDGLVPAGREAARRPARELRAGLSRTRPELPVTQLGRHREGPQQAEQAIEIGSGRPTPTSRRPAASRSAGWKISTGSTAEGLGIMEEATSRRSAASCRRSPPASPTARRSPPRRDLTDYKRASEWTEATERWCERQSVSGFPGVCRIHRAEVIASAVPGNGPTTSSARRRPSSPPTTRSRRWPMATTRSASSASGCGDLDQAEEALRQAHSLGRSPQPALARIRLAQGNIGAASKAIASAVNEDRDLLAKTWLPPARAEIALAARTSPRPEPPPRSLTTSWRPTRRRPSRQPDARPGEGLPGRGRCDRRRPRAAGAIGLWREVAALYDVARGRAPWRRRCACSRMTTRPTSSSRRRGTSSSARRPARRRDDGGDAQGPGRPSRRTAARPPDIHVHRHRGLDEAGRDARRRGLGCAPALARRRDPGPSEEVRRRARELDRGRLLRGVRLGPTRGRLRDRHPAGPRRAPPVERCFALSVRIGLHSAEASQRTDDYSGIGVHLASRVAALGAGGEIVATADTLEEAGDVATEAPREAMPGACPPRSVSPRSAGVDRRPRA
jgi:hypothetical protein